MSDPRTGSRFRRAGVVVAIGVLAISLASCGSNKTSTSNTTTTNTSTSSGGGSSTTVNLGYFPNLTHASAIVGIDKGYFKDELANDNATLKYTDFNSGSDTITALLNGDLDATYIGPSPAVTAYLTSKNVSIISGATSGGASLVVAPSIKTIDDLKGTTIATPGAGNTQDIAFKYFLKQHGFSETSDGTGDVTILPQDNSESVTQFQQGQIQGGWLPEPYASLMVAEGGVRLVNEKSLWKGGKFVTTELLVNNDFLKAHPDLVNDLLQGQIEANDYIAKNPDSAKTMVAKTIQEVTGSAAIPASVLNQAWSQLTFTNDPLADTLLASAAHAKAVGLIQSTTGLSGIYDLGPLNKLLTHDGEPTVSGPTS